MVVITGTRHSGTLFLSSTLQTAGLTTVSRKKVLAGATPPPGSMVAVPIPKLPKVSDRARHVVGLVRPWRSWAGVMTEEEPQPEIPHEVSWWFSNYALVCELMRTKSRFILLSHDNLLSRPEPSMRRVLEFLGRAEAFESCLLLPAVAPSMPPFVSRALSREEQDVLDSFWKVVHADAPMTRRTFQRMSVLQETLRRRYPQAGGVAPMPANELQTKVPA